MKRCKVPFKKLNEHAIVPTNGSKQAAGHDLYACIDGVVLVIPAGQTVMIRTGIAVAIPEGYFGAIYARSGLATKSGLRPANCVGVVDSDYRGEVMVALHNDSDQIRHVENGERIAQLVVTPYLPIDLYEVDELDETERGSGGFGSTGK